MFEREQHRNVAALLTALDSEKLSRCKFLFDCLSLTDCYAEKLLANADRWADRQVLSRDLIDLSALRYRIGPIPAAAWRKVEVAYRTAAREDLRKALAAFYQDPPHQQRCLEGLQIKETQEIMEGLSLLIRELGA